MKKILVPIDFSLNSKNALRIAAEIAVKAGARLELLHANVATIYSMPLSESAVMADYGDDQEYDETATIALEKLKIELHENPAFAKLKVDVRVEEVTGSGIFNSKMQRKMGM